MERSFSQFGHADHFNFDAALGLNDTQSQVEEIRDIESYLPHFKICYLNPSPIDICSLRESLSDENGNSSGLHLELESPIKCEDGEFELLIHLELPNQYPSLEAPRVSFNCSGLSDNVNTYLNKYLTKKLAREFNPNGVLLETVIWIQSQVTHELQNRNKTLSTMNTIAILR
ncbi:Oidioi.mRNA.OKI2018_I69.chr2.g5846.t1.cds [Oikopleura dioica]|uniref:Oidioi.mRNA.OKI2018_I69.chr2.g5846.t1.cds n=1 Tax=Oikopleura dioica TaxID=34765 RepID=A0ABN7T5V9_OIKDI|nr:Oidioi.mRNA.OKI2018_I69.chr2.g5846.t1.cds [Oikopleura dioica]